MLSVILLTNLCLMDFPFFFTAQTNIKSFTVAQHACHQINAHVAHTLVAHVRMLTPLSLAPF